MSDTKYPINEWPDGLVELILHFTPVMVQSLVNHKQITQSVADEFLTMREEVEYQIYAQR